MRSLNRFALKEWSGACDRLARGEHTVLLRKGGLLERRGTFDVEHREFFLFPTRFHEQGETPPLSVELSLYAEVVEDREFRDLGPLRRLEGMHALDWEAVGKRFHYGSAPGLHALLLRAWRLARPVPVENARVHEGCRSWVDLGVDHAIPPAAAALADDAFARAKSAFDVALHG